MTAMTPTAASTSPPPFEQQKQSHSDSDAPPAASSSSVATAFDLSNVRPTPNAIRVLNLSPAASEKAVKEFFAFCGKIVSFQMISTGQTKEAFILFDRESAANTSLLLTNAVIVDRSVVVRPFFDAHEVRDPVATVEANERDAAAGRLEGHKPLTRVVAELLASGYTLTETIVKKGVEIDNKYSVSRALSSFLVSAQARAMALDQKYRVTGMLRDIDARLHISENASAAIAKATEIGERALNTSAGQRVKDTVVSARDKALSVAQETRQIVDERRGVAAASSPSPVGSASTLGSGADGIDAASAAPTADGSARAGSPSNAASSAGSGAASATVTPPAGAIHQAAGV